MPFDSNMASGTWAYQGLDLVLCVGDCYVWGGGVETVGAMEDWGEGINNREQGTGNREQRKKRNEKWEDIA